MADWHGLIVEDESDGAEVVTRILDYHRKSYSVAASAEEALSLLKTQTPDILIVDLALPEMDGWQLLKEVRADPATADIPAVAITAYHSASVALESIKAGFQAYFPKPLDATTFARELDRILEGE